MQQAVVARDVGVPIEDDRGAVDGTLRRERPAHHGCSLGTRPADAATSSIAAQHGPGVGDGSRSRRGARRESEGTAERDQQRRRREGHPGPAAGATLDVAPRVGRAPHGGREGGSLGADADGVDHRCMESCGSHHGSLLVEPALKGPVEARVGCHRVIPPARTGSRSSASMAARIAWVARWSRDWTVPMGAPSASAASAIDRPR